jgi:hypothetical protein
LQLQEKLPTQASLAELGDTVYPIEHKLNCKTRRVFTAYKF